MRGAWNGNWVRWTWDPIPRFGLKDGKMEGRVGGRWRRSLSRVVPFLEKKEVGRRPSCGLVRSKSSICCRWSPFIWQRRSSRFLHWRSSQIKVLSNHWNGGRHPVGRVPKQHPIIGLQGDMLRSSTWTCRSCGFMVFAEAWNVKIATIRRLGNDEGGILEKMKTLLDELMCELGCGAFSVQTTCVVPLSLVIENL
jgi:hypothetical protein